ncbi:MAG: hypothetical protein JO189_02090 [Deltaproteobacteria bacterium]|nr:hypothetical protein [Deltaproteobacteria bacterium]
MQHTGEQPVHHSLRSGYVIALGLLFVFWTVLLPSFVYALSAADDQQIDQGFTLFTSTTFNGNGRTCGTCHVPQFDYNLTPAQIAGLKPAQKNLVLATNSPNLENPTLALTLGLFNITDAQPGDPGTGNTPVGPFRSSMALGGFKFTSLNTCDNAAVITSISTDGSGNTTVTTAQPIELFEKETVFIGATGTAFDGISTQVTGFGTTTTASGVLATTEFTLSTPSITTSTSSTTGNVIGVGACPGGAPNPVAGIDDGNRNIELGWAGDGVPFPADPTTMFPGSQASNCIAAINQLAQNPTSLFDALRAFSLGAVRHHASRTLARVPGVDFRCPTSTELDAMANFQIYLGRQFELALCPNGNPSPSGICNGSIFNASNFAKGLVGTQTPNFSPNVSNLQPLPPVLPGSPLQNVITFKDDRGGSNLTNNTAERGKAIFLDGRALCEGCHSNGGAQDLGGDVLAEPELTDAQGNNLSPITTATTWTANNVYFAALGSVAGNPFAGIRWSVVVPLSDRDNPNFFLAWDTTPTAGEISGTSGNTEPIWDNAPNPGDTLNDGGIVWMNLGVAAQRLNMPGKNFDHGNSTENLTTTALAIGSNPPILASLDSFVAPVEIPFDPANIGNLPNNPGDFNTQSIIEAARKTSFFHNGAFVHGSIEDAVTFYFSTIFDDSPAGNALDRLTGPLGRGDVGGACTGFGSHTGCGGLALSSLADTYEGGHSAQQQRQVFNDLGFFLRALSSVYSIADCERLVQDSIDRTNLGLPLTVPVLNCTTNLNDVVRVINNARVNVPSTYFSVAHQATTLIPQLNLALQQSGPSAIFNLTNIKKQLINMRHSISTISPATPDLP